jgi:hypothetical protein
MILHAANDNFANSQHPFFGDQTDSNYLHSSQAGSSFFSNISENPIGTTQSICAHQKIPPT